MRRRSVFIVLAALAVVCVLAPAASARRAAPAAKAWTVMVYMDGDNDLERYVTRDIETELCALGSNADVDVVVLADRGPGYDTSRGDWRTTKLFFCTEGMRADAASAVADWGERDMGDPRTLADFVTWAKTDHPAAGYLLCFWDHGYLWFPTYSDIWDATDDDCLGPGEQASAMREAGPVSVVAWDLCQQQIVEIAAEWQPFARAMAGSESYVNWEGIQYDAVIAALRSDPSLGPQDVADVVASTARGDSRTFSSIALDERFDRVLTAVDDLSAALKDGLPLYRDAYVAARRETQVYSGGCEFDLWDAAHNLSAGVSDPVIRSRCEALMAAVASDVTLSWTNGGRKVKNSHGLAVWWPIQKARLNRYSATDFAYYRHMRFSQLTGWADFLAAFCR
jgi:hypothetical protein